MAAANPVVKIVALSGSLRKASFNTALIRSGTPFSSLQYWPFTTMELSKESVTGIEIEHIDISSLPMLNTDLIADGKYPPVVEAFRKQILKADSILFASPENNYSISAPLKNAIDWASLPQNCWGDKAAAIVSAGAGFGGGRSQYHLRQIGVYLDLHFINKPEFFLNAFQPPAKFDDNGNLIDESAKEKLKEILVALRDFTLRLKN